MISYILNWQTGTLIRTISGINNQNIKSIQCSQNKDKDKDKDKDRGRGIGKGIGSSNNHVSENRRTLISFTPEEHQCLCAYFAAQVRIINDKNDDNNNNDSNYDNNNDNNNNNNNNNNDIFWLL